MMLQRLRKVEVELLCLLQEIGINAEISRFLGGRLIDGDVICNAHNQAHEPGASMDNLSGLQRGSNCIFEAGAIWNPDDLQIPIAIN